MTQQKPSLLSSIILFLVIIALFSLSGILFPIDLIWYNTLAEPDWLFSNNVIAIIWFVLYALIALTVVVLQKTIGLDNLNHSWYLLFAINYVINQAYTFLLSIQKDLSLAFYDCLAASISTLLLLLYTGKYSRWAALLLFPYLVWSCLTAYMSWVIYQVNL
ncbi:TspO/MBR family protein [Brevibacillus laterosporus]|uniref:TspO/MBR family protein n=1 Tax=Brevibacillus laterosporus TaxID=1465 RepID=UPI002651394A|nr:tryptophan-rich sensory protein [Brevibacillus laterosporus]MDN9009262.1 tryptophan-rich sensory protein [Brevibacillus laterosporus]MDO0940031.1 tryptophan-rich sensory protein [Brevibacillus laterosporus]